ncbi:MAG: hypothetical protein R3314_10905 [Longimicrobiales bacterium]|nr:hypothetical protein [Longimicrobiales bacterium]
MTDEWMIVLVTFFVIGIPVMGLTARLAIKPLVESIIRVREAFLQEGRDEAVSARDVERLEAEVRELREQVHRLTEAAEFDRKLLSSD